MKPEESSEYKRLEPVNSDKVYGNSSKVEILEEHLVANTKFDH